MAWGSRPSIIWAFFTPPSRARAQQSAFGIIPLVRMPSFLRASNCGLSTAFRREFSSFISRKMPRTSVISTSFSAFRAAAIFAAAISAFILRAFPSSSPVP